MSARLENTPERLAALRHGDITQFERQLEAAGFTPELLFYMLSNNASLNKWVQAAKDIYDKDVDTVRLQRDRPVELRNGLHLRHMQVVDPDSIMVWIGSGGGAVVLNRDTWWCSRLRGVEIQLRGTPSIAHSTVAVRYRRNQSE